MALPSIFSNSEFERLDLTIKMKKLMEQFCLHARRDGVRITPYRDPSLRIFSKLPPEGKRRAYDAFVTYYKVCSGATYEDISLSDDRNLLWYVIKEFGLRPPSDLFDKLEADDIVEIYNTEFIQIYRNFAFFDVCSYSLEEIFSYEWRDLYERDATITDKLAELAFSMLSGKVNHTVSILHVGEHQLTESFSPSRHKMVVTHTYLSPLFNKAGQAEAFAIFSKAKVTGRKIGEVFEFRPAANPNLS